MRVVTAVLALLLAFSSASRSFAADGQLISVALSGDMAPGIGGGSFAGFGFPALNDAGQTAFTGTLDGTGVNNSNRLSLWTDKEDVGLALVARTGNVAPGAGNRNFVSLGSPILNETGRTAFLGEVPLSVVGGENNLGIWSEGGGTGLALVALRGKIAPDTSGAEFAVINVPVFNDAGQAAFVGTLTGTGLDSTNSRGIWSEGGGNGVALVARTGSTAPSTGGALFSSLNVPVLNSAGQTAFLGGLVGMGVGNDNRTGIWSGGADAGLNLVVRSGQTAPDTSAGISFSGFGGPAFNSEGQTAFFGILTGAGVGSSNSTGIWSEGGGTGLALVARSGNIAPETIAGVNFAGFGGPVLNDEGQTAFTGFLTGAGVDSSNSSGIWSTGHGSQLELVAWAGNEAPETSAGVNFSSFDSPVLNDAGQTAFTAFLTGAGVDSSNDSGIWAEDSSGVLKLIAREGGLLDVADGLGTDLRTVSSLSFLGNTSNGNGRGSGFNNSGQLAFQADFIDGSSGVFISNLAADAPVDTADFDDDGDVDGADFLQWQRGETASPLDAGILSRWKSEYGTTATLSADFDTDGDVDGADFFKWQRGETTSPLGAGELTFWKDQYGTTVALPVSASVPEPSTLLLLLGPLAGCIVFGRQR